MNDLERTLPTQLRSLADDLAPDADPLDQVAGARARYRQQRRTRIGVAALVAATVAIVVAVPTALGSLSAEPGDVAGPGIDSPHTDDAEPMSAEESAARATAEEEARRAEEAGTGRDTTDAAAARAAAEAAREARQAARTGLVAQALTDRDPYLDLRLAAGAECPDGAPALGEALQTTVTAAGAGALVDGCRWTAPGLTLTLSFTPGQTEEQMRAEVDGGVAASGCTVQAMPSAVDVTPLTLCPIDGAQLDGPVTWALRVPDGDRAGYWLLSAAETADAAPDAGGPALLALVDLAAATWGR